MPLVLTGDTNINLTHSAGHQVEPESLTWNLLFLTLSPMLS